nr:hypothetical protein [Tanacetum cinerariifolium]
MEDTMLELLEDCQQKEIYCMHNDVEDLIESALNSKLLDQFEILTDEKSLSNEDVLMIYSNSLFDDEEIIPTKIDPYYFNAESNLIESLLNRDTLIDSSPKFDYLLKEFSGELTYIDLIPPGIKEADFDLEEEIRPVDNLLYDNSSLRLPEELNAEIPDTILEFLSPYPIPVEDSDSLMEEIDLFLATDDLMPPGIENDDYYSEGDIHFLEELLSDDPFPLPENESSNFDHHDDPSFPRPPPKPPDVEVFFDFEPNTGVLTAKMVEDISEHHEFSGELTYIDPIPPGIEEADFDLEEEIRPVDNLLYDNSSLRLPEKLNAEIADTILEFLSPSPIPVEDSDSLMEEIDLFLATDDLMPPGIENDDYDSEGDIHFLEELLRDDPFPLPENESSNFDHHDDPSFPRPPSEPPNVKVFFDFEPNTGVLTAKMVEDISEHHVLMPKVLPSQPTPCLNFDTLLPFSS